MNAERFVAADGFERAAAEGVHRIGVPTPFAVGRVNVYLIEDEPLTLVDSGPNSGRSLDELERGVRELGHALEDIGLVLISHQHIDHIGLVQIVRERSGAEVATIEQCVPFVERYTEVADQEDEYATELMLRHGMAEEIVEALRSVSNSFRGWGARADVTRVLADGETIELRDRRLEVHFRPGHSPSDTVFLDPERRMLLAADHLIAHISSNPLLTRPLGRDGKPISAERPHSLVRYLESLRATREMDLDLVLPGHGDPIADHRTLIDSRFALHIRRADKIHGLIADRPLSAHEIAQELWGNVAVTQAFLTLSEVLGHVDLLLADGRAEEIEENGVIRFRAL